MDLFTSTVFSPGTTPEPAHLDQILIGQRQGLLAVADALGDPDSRRAGIRIALDTTRANLERHEDILARFRRNPTGELRTRILGILEESFSRTAQEIFAFARRRPGLRITLDVVLLLANEAFVAHVGDGRVYLVRRGLVHQLTVDHIGGDDAGFSDVETEADAEDPRATVRAFGPQPSIRVESLCMEMTDSDRFVIATYGIHASIPEGVLHHHLVSESLENLGPALTRCAPAAPLAAAAAQLGGSEPEVMDGGRSRLAILEPMPLFAHCTPRELRTIASATHPRRFPAETILFQQGDPGTEFYLVISGTIRIEVDGKAIVTLGPGSNFGEMAMLDNPQRSASAVCGEDCEVMIISRESFFALLKGNPMLAVKILWNMLLRLSANLRRTSVDLARAQELVRAAEKVAAMAEVTDEIDLLGDDDEPTTKGSAKTRTRRLLGSASTKGRGVTKKGSG